MAWIDEGSRYVWDIEFNRWQAAANRSYQLADQYKVFTEVETREDGKFQIITRWEISDHYTEYDYGSA